MESKRKELVEEMKKRRPTASLITKNMNSTSALRRQKLVNLEPPVESTMGRWPAQRKSSPKIVKILQTCFKMNMKTTFDHQTLHSDTQTFKFNRNNKKNIFGWTIQYDYILNNNLSYGTFPRGTLPGEGQFIRYKSTDVTAKRTAVLRGLPVILGDENTDFLKTCFDCNDPDMSHIPIGILTIVPEDGQISLDLLHLQSLGTTMILGGRIAMDDPENLPHAICLLFGLTP